MEGGKPFAVADDPKCKHCPHPRSVHTPDLVDGRYSCRKCSCPNFLSWRVDEAVTTDEAGTEMPKKEEVDHPDHYGGADNPYETIKVIEAWDLGFHLGNAVKYISRAGKKKDALVDLKKAAWYLEREIARRDG